MGSSTVLKLATPNWQHLTGNTERIAEMIRDGLYLRELVCKNLDHSAANETMEFVVLLFGKSPLNFGEI